MQEYQIILKTNDGNLDCRVFANDERANPPIIFYMDAPAIREELREMCRKISRNGFNVLLPNLFYRVGTEGNYPFDQANYKNKKEEFNKMIITMNNTTNAMIAKDTKVILDFISKRFSNSKRIGVVGYCMSGRFVVYCAAMFPEKICAIASFYGVDIVTVNSDSPHLLAKKIKGELYLAFAEKDSWVPNDIINIIKKTFPNKKNKVFVEIYKGTDHGFAFPSRHSYKEEATKTHWKRLFNLFDRNLKD